MKTNIALRGALLAPAFLALTFLTPSADGAPAVTKRPLSDFLEAQGATADFFSPVPDYVGWVDGDFTNFALVDYAGLADAYIEGVSGESLGTRVRGKVTERALGDGTAVVRVQLFTKNALAFTQSIEDLVANDFVFATTPTNFGAKAVDVTNGAAPAVGWAHLDVSFVIEAPGAALPDLQDVVVSGPGDFAPVSYRFLSVSFGERPNGTWARLKIHQVADTDPDTGEFVYSKEVVELEDLDNDD